MKDKIVTIAGYVIIGLLSLNGLLYPWYHHSELVEARNVAAIQTQRTQQTIRVASQLAVNNGEEVAAQFASAGFPIQIGQPEGE